MQVYTLEQLREKANMLPLKPGVYLMLDKTGDIIYVGKAKALKNRVTSYFRGEHLPKVAAMVEHVADFNVIVVQSEFEALVLENSLIKLHKPHYNILLKDDKGYPFVRLDRREAYPTFSLVNQTAKDGASYFGPFGGRSVTHEILDTISKALRLPTCSRRFPRDVGKARPCLNYHMGTCAGYCLKDASPEEYRRSIDEAVLVLEGKTDELTRDLQSRMEAAAEELRFEYAAELRDRLKAVKELQNHQRVIATAYSDTDAVAFVRGARCCFTVLHFINGNLSAKDVQMMPEPLEEDAEALAALIQQYYTQRGSWPKQILLPWEIEGQETVEALLSEQAGRRVRLEVPQRGDRRRLTESAALNAHEEILRSTTAVQRTAKTLEWLQKALDLPAYPARIEAFDISNLGDTGIVAGMTVFVNGRPLKRDYRKFRMKETLTQNDYASMHEAVTRRVQRYLDGDEKFDPLPDLLLIDGGAEHATVAVEALKALSVSLPVFGMVKDDRHRTRALVTPQGHEIGISGNQAVFALIGTIQEETHRYSIEFQRSLRSASFTSQLDRIPGVGAKRRNDLLKAFRSVKAVREASLAQLQDVVPKNTAQAVFDYYHPKEEGEPPCESSPEPPAAES